MSSRERVKKQNQRDVIFSDTNIKFEDGSLGRSVGHGVENDSKRVKEDETPVECKCFGRNKVRVDTLRS